jgi:hypothetical protein
MLSSRRTTSAVVFTSANTRDGLEFGGMRIPIDLGHRIAHQDHPIVIFQPTTHSRRDADACGHTGNDACRHAQVSQDGVERSI